MYRGWYKGKREFGSAAVPWEFCMAEWNAQFLGDQAFQISDDGEGEPALGGPASSAVPGSLASLGLSQSTLGSRTDDDHARPSWPCTAPPTAGLSAPGACRRIHQWEYGTFWKLRDGVNKNARKELKVDWENLQRPGYSPDYIDERFERMDLAYERADWIPMAPAQALLRNNMPLLAYIAGAPSHFTSKDHNFLPAESVEKQLIVINNSRETVSGECEWTLALPQAATGSKAVTVPDRRAGTHSVALRSSRRTARRQIRTERGSQIQHRRNSKGRLRG